MAPPVAPGLGVEVETIFFSVIVKEDSAEMYIVDVLNSASGV